MEGRASVAAGPADAAVGRAVHHILARGQAAAALVHRRHVNPATALQVAGDLDVADEAGVELDSGPGGAVVRVGDVEGAAANVKVVIGNVHSSVEGAGRVVIHPHRLTVVIPAVVGACAGAPSDAVGGGPQADALAATAGRKVAGEPHAQARIVHHYRVAEVGAVAATQRLAGVPRGPIIGRIREAAVTAARSAAVVVVDDPGVVGAAPFHALRLGHFGIGGIREDNIYVGAADEQRRRQQVLDKLREALSRRR
ncbi:MAG: hypothetical protein DMF33_10810 [Verrucomicrobia bacterium]|nr:MAG: hypothetical protein DMF33_10810 [Verrucomicrobiota bacterium]